MRSVEAVFEPWPTGEMDTKVAKALLQAVRFRDFTHWRREKGMGLEYSLKIGFGYKLHASPDPDIKGMSAVYTVSYHEDDMILEMELDGARIDEGVIELLGSDCEIRLFLPVSFDTDRYIRRRMRKPRPKGIDVEYALRRGRGVDTPWTGRTDVADRRGEYWGSDSRARTRRLEPGFMELLDRVTAMQRFDGLKEHYDEEECNEKGPILLKFTGMDRTSYCTGIRVEAEGGLEGFARFELRGTLSADGDGIVVAGKGFRFTMVMDDTVPNGIEDAYLDDHPVPSWSVPSESNDAGIPAEERP